MNSNVHPTREELTRHVFSETEGELRATLEAHLGECPECAKDFASMQETLCRLDRWQIAPARRRRRFNWQPLKWAAAAVILLSVGLGLGRFTAPAVPDISAFRAEIEADLAQTISAEIQSQIGVAVNAEVQAALTASREEDRAYALALFENLQREQTSIYMTLRKDLETLATLTEDEMLNARRSLLQVAAFAQTAAGESVSK